jgi:hypothetical protein
MQYTLSAAVQQNLRAGMAGVHLFRDRMAGWQRANTGATSNLVSCKSFLVLFFKKELLPLLSTPPDD